MLQDESRAAVSQVRTGAQELLEQAGAFGRPVGSLAGTETGLASELSMIEMGVQARPEAAAGYEYYTGRVTPMEKRRSEAPLPPVIQAIDASIRIMESRLANAHERGQIEAPEWKQTAEAIQNYIAAQKEERKKLLDELERQKGERERATLAVAPWQSRRAASPQASQAQATAAEPPTQAKAANFEEYSRLAREATAAAEKQKADKQADKDEAKAQKRADSAQQRADAKFDADQAKLKLKADASHKAAEKLEATVAADTRKVEEIRHRIGVWERIHSAPSQRAGSATRKGASKPKPKSAVTVIREQEEIRGLRNQLAAAEAKRAADEAEHQAKVDQTNELLKTLITATRERQKQPVPPRPPQGKPATIGGN